MLCNFRFWAPVWAAALVFSSHAAYGQAADPPFTTAAFNAEVREWITVCSAVPAMYAATGIQIKGGDLPFFFGIAPVAGAPYSAVGITDSAMTLIDGNRITHHETTRFFRDSHGRTRIEHASTPLVASFSPFPMPPLVLINDPVSGECYVLDTPHKISHVLVHPAGASAIHPPIALGLPPAHLVWPGFDITQGGASSLMTIYSSPEAGSQVALEKQTIEDLPVVGTRVKHQIRAGFFGNERPVFVTVEDWFSPDLGVTVRDTQHTTSGAEIDFHLQQITRSEPDPALFQVPSEYTRKLETVTLRTQATLTPVAPEARAVQPQRPPPPRIDPIH